MGAGNQKHDLSHSQQKGACIDQLSRPTHCKQKSPNDTTDIILMQFERRAAFKWRMIHCRMGSEKQIQGDPGEDVSPSCFIAESFSFSMCSPASRQAVSYELADLMTKHGYFLTLRSINRRGRKICSHRAEAVTV